VRRNEKAYSVRDDQVHAMLLQKFLKEHCKVEHLQKRVEKTLPRVQKVSVEDESEQAGPANFAQPVGGMMRDT